VGNPQNLSIKYGVAIEMKTMKTDEKLLKALKKSAQKMMTGKEIHEQKISFIIGSSKNDSAITRERVEAELNKLSGLPQNK